MVDIHICIDVYISNKLLTHNGDKAKHHIKLTAQLWTSVLKCGFWNRSINLWNRSTNLGNLSTNLWKLSLKSKRNHVEPSLNLRYIDHAGIERVCGGADLKSSQYYPRLFGHAVGQLYHRHASEAQKAVKSHMILGLD